MKQGRAMRSKGQEDQQKTRTFFRNENKRESSKLPFSKRMKTLRRIKEKFQEAKQEYRAYSTKCKTTLTALADIKKSLDFDYVENSNFLRTNVKAVQGNRKDKHVIVFYRTSKNFPSTKIINDYLTGS